VVEALAQSATDPSRLPHIEPTAAERCYAALAPFAFAAVHVAARLRGATPAELRQRRGFLPAASAAPLWLHGASAGEMAAAHALVGVMRGAGLQFAAAYTTTNAAGRQWIGSRLAPGDVAALTPWDRPGWVKRACATWRPRALVLIETEIWPALIRIATETGVPVISASARLYPPDVARYRRAGAWLRPSFQRLALVLAQDATQAAYFTALGVSPARCLVAGNLKHAAPPDVPSRAAARASFGVGAAEPLLVFGSLHADEVPLIAPAVDRLLAGGGRCIVAPRHPDGVAALDRLAASRQWRLARRSVVASAQWSVLVLDRIGELRTAYAAADLAVVGGSFTPHGGHDLVEAVRAGAPVLFGPHTAHVAAAAEALAAATPVARLPNAAPLADLIAATLGDDPGRADLLVRQRAALPDSAAIAAEYVRALSPLIG
jgi:3-deoxy-D-manno-octulosonic-acid transferase